MKLMSEVHFSKLTKNSFLGPSFAHGFIITGVHLYKLRQLKLVEIQAFKKSSIASKKIQSHSIVEATPSNSQSRESTHTSISHTPSLSNHHIQLSGYHIGNLRDRDII